MAAVGERNPTSDATGRLVVADPVPDAQSLWAGSPPGPYALVSAGVAGASGS